MLHIMVVDDEAPIRDWLVYCIQKCEAASSVTSAVNGEEAYRRILEQKPNVVFTDIRMPGMDGLELMSKVRDILPFTVFIILTNYAEFSYAKQAISLGAREYILKSEMRSSDIQRIVAEIAATTAKIRSEKVHDVLQDGVRQGSADLDIAHEAGEHTGGFLRGFPGAAQALAEAERGDPLEGHLAQVPSGFHDLREIILFHVSYLLGLSPLDDFIIR